MNNANLGLNTRNGKSWQHRYDCCEPGITWVSGIHPNFRMPDLLSIGLGGGSLISDDGSDEGPRSVGHRLVRDGLVFGDSTLTATDSVVAAGQARLAVGIH